MRRYALSVLLVVLFVWQHCISIASEDVTNGEGSLQKIGCWFEIDAVDANCYQMFVPENYDNPAARWIGFPVVKFATDENTKRNSPIIHLGGGGPGALLLDNINFYVYASWSESSGRDVYLIDPRGVDGSFPNVSCPEYVDMIEIALGEHISPRLENERTLTAYRKCKDRLTDWGVDLSQYHSANIARDVENLRKALGVKRWNLYGVSYAGRYAQTIVRDYPNSVESMVLDSTIFPNIRYTERTGSDLLRIFDTLFDYCENLFGCNVFFKDVRKRFWELTDNLNRNPLLVEIDHPFEDGKLSVFVGGNLFMNAYANALYDARQYEFLAGSITSLEKRELGYFDVELLGWLTYLLNRDYADGVAISHYCHEQAPFVDFDAAIKAARKFSVRIRENILLSLEFSKQLCTVWDIDEASSLESEPVITDVPTLFLQGALDPVSFVEDMQDQRHYFKNSDEIVFENISHGVLGVHSCGFEIVEKFFIHKLGFRDHVSCLQ